MAVLDMFLKQRHVVLLTIAFIVATVLFGMMPATMLNYGYDYFQFLHPLWLAFPVLATITLWRITGKGEETQRNILVVTQVFLVILLPFACWFLRTQFHCFGGDGAVGNVPQDDFSISDWIPPCPGKGRLDGLGATFVAKCCSRMGLFSHSLVMPSILSTSVYSCIVGAIFVAIAFFSLRKKSGLFPMLVTCPFVFNFFGNIDAYSFSLVVGLVFLVVCIPFAKGKLVKFRHLLMLILLWGIGMWTHPFHAFDGFIIAVFFTRWIKQWKLFSKIEDFILPGIFGIIFLIAVKLSPWGNTWFAWDFGKPPPTFSIDTFTHYLNMLLLPSVPWIVVSFLNRRDDGTFKVTFAMFLSASLVFWGMAFTLGVVDQFNYYHLLFFFLMPWVLLIAKHPLPLKSSFCVFICNLCLLVPMVAVHSSKNTIHRAQALYPIDPCHHNRVMSWQTHLGLCLGDNFQENKAIKTACLHTFMDGARNAYPDMFRTGNYIYHTAFLYHFGDFLQGKRQLEELIAKNPQVLGYFLGVRPAFIYFNRKKLWDDIDEILQRHHPQLLPKYREVVKTSRLKAITEPYYVCRPKYAVTEY